MAETGFSQVSATYLPHTIIRSNPTFLESVTFQQRGRMLSSFSTQSLQRYGHFWPITIVPVSRAIFTIAD